MTRTGADWSVSINLAPGTYRYKFVVDDNRWTVNPENSKTEYDGNGNFNSLLIVGTKNTCTISEPPPGQDVASPALRRRRLQAIHQL